ncbi:MAG TPA: DNA recombination protein RmuC [Actinomycetota bacterium]
MEPFGYAVLGLALGALAGAILAWAGGPRGDPQVGGRLEVQAAELRRLADAAGARQGADERLRTEVAAARRALEELSLLESERRERDRESWEVVRRLSNVLAGGPSKGRAGENVLRERLSELPPGMLATDLRVNGKVVEFGLLLPDGRRLPVDSKWPAVAELEALVTADPDERETRAREVERQVALRAREVAQYLDPAVTAPVAVAAVPDAAYAVLRRAHADAFARGVVIVPYSTALPVLLFLYSLVRRLGDSGDAQACLSEVAALLDAMEGVLENKLARAAAMIANGADELRSSLGKARGSVERGRSGAREVDPARSETLGGAVGGTLEAVPERPRGTGRLPRWTSPRLSWASASPRRPAARPAGSACTSRGRTGSSPTRCRSSRTAARCSAGSSRWGSTWRPRASSSGPTRR